MNQLVAQGVNFSFRILVAWSCVVSGLIHISGPYFFLESLIAYRIFPLGVSWMIAAFLIHLLLVVGICIATGLFRPGSYLVCGILFLMFSTGQIVSVFRGQSISCGCFGPSEDEIGWMSIGISITLCIISFCLFAFEPKSEIGNT